MGSGLVYVYASTDVSTLLCGVGVIGPTVDHFLRNQTDIGDAIKPFDAPGKGRARVMSPALRSYPRTSGQYRAVAIAASATIRRAT
jgi:hypothetical protein